MAREISKSHLTGVGCGMFWIFDRVGALCDHFDLVGLRRLFVYPALAHAVMFLYPVAPRW